MEFNRMQLITPFLKSITLLISSFLLHYPLLAGNAVDANRLKNTYFDIVGKYQKNQQLVEQSWKELAALYTDSSRHYHTLDHIDHFYEELLLCQNDLQNWESVFLAMVYHDVVYVATNRDNEEKSAEMAARHLRRMGFDEAFIATCNQLIMATKSHKPTGNQTIDLFIDADMSILGLPLERYKRYVQQVHQEYSMVPNFAARRKVFLNTILKTDRIFITPFFFNRYEKAARYNLEQELTNFKGGRYVVVVSIDGFRPEFYLEEAYPTPNLKHFKANGVYALGVNGVFPTVTYPSHTTIVTGATPSVHGIYYNTPFEPTGVTGLWNSTYDLIKTRTIWQAAKNRGLRTASVSWPVTEGATSIDYNIPESFSLKDGLDRRRATSEHATPKGLFEEVQQHATGIMTAMDLNINYFKMDENIGRMAAYIIRTYKPNLMTIHLPTTDKAQHSQGRNGEDVKLALATADRAIGGILEAFKLAGIEDSATIIVTGDHGFVDTHTMLSPNTWLVAAGLLPVKLSPDSSWKAIFQATGGSAFLKVKDLKDKATIQKVYQLLRNQPASVQNMFSVLDGEALKQSGCDPDVVLALLPVQGVSMRGATNGPLMQRSVGGTHGYYPYFREIQTGFVAFGAGIGKAVIPVMSLTDVAPIVMRLLNVPFTTEQGTAIPGVFSEAGR